MAQAGGHAADVHGVPELDAATARVLRRAVRQQA